MAPAIASSWQTWGIAVVLVGGGILITLSAERDERLRHLWWIGSLIVLGGWLFAAVLAEDVTDDRHRSVERGLSAGRCRELHDPKHTPRKVRRWERSACDR
jgi:hypothetical protein